MNTNEGKGGEGLFVSLKKVFCNILLLCCAAPTLRQCVCVCGVCVCGVRVCVWCACVCVCVCEVYGGNCCSSST